MTFDWDEYMKLDEDEKDKLIERIEKEALEEAKKRPRPPPGSIALEKARIPEGLRVVGRMNPDGTVHYYADDEKPTPPSDDQDQQDT